MEIETSAGRWRRSIGIARWLFAGATLFASACASQGDVASDFSGAVRTTGVIVSIDTRPWTYDGNAVVALDTAEYGRLQLQLPARWSLCQAAPVDAEALAVGMRVEVVGAAVEEGAVVVCADPSHRLAPLDAGSSANADGAR